MINSKISSISENHINCDQLTEFKEIAKGAFGNIRKAVWKVRKITVALKSLRADVSSVNTIEDFVKEHSENILVNEGSMKIADFGLSTNLNEMSEALCINYKNTSYDCGMPAYVEPQYIKNPNYEFTKKSDIYSLGVIFWEISSGKPPYQSFISIDTIAVYIFQGMREAPIKGTPQKYVDLYTECWDEEPDKRPDSMSVLKTLDPLLINEIP
ncbi:kinase-like protein [Gigaspora margarita]|uniref:Kinase-like protein n=1 Tax=Gigaspora margarita TaxID=4874 RepID=A0A8H3X5J7_GIGMA|nr:kinase-like protein [Gigaspora margarita]